MSTQTQTTAGSSPPLPAQGTTGRAVFAQYASPPGAYDEMFSGPGAVRPAQGALHALLAEIGAPELTRRWDHSQRLIHENGIVYGAYGDAGRASRPWQLDPLPLLIGSDEWSALRDGLAQRALLLDRTLSDLLGPQRLLKEGVIPPQAVFGHPGFRLAFHGLAPPGGSYLHHYAADLGRTATGAWLLIAERTEAPSGLGFALENRVVVSRMLPEAFRTCRVQRLAPFFIAMRENFRRLAPAHRDNPRVVIYSQGPQSINYFEDAYLARYLGYSLVEGGDLAVRDQHAWLKTLDGLQPVDVLIRRPNSETCDPLEFADDGESGVAGLCFAAGQQGVAVCNALGSGLVESPLFMAWMPELARRLLDCELSLPQARVWWCGDPSCLKYVLERLDELAILPAYRVRGRAMPIGADLHRLSTADLAARLRAAPEQYIARERLTRSTAPAWVEGQARPAYVTLRAFAVRNGENYLVMDGGLARTSSESPRQEMPLVVGEGSKDAWVAGREAPEPVSLLPNPGERIRLRRTAADLPSRVADNLFWMGRLMERADAAARLLRTLILRMTSEADVARTATLPALIRALADQGQIDPGFAVEGLRELLPDIEQALPELAFDRREPGSLRSTVDQFVETARRVRDRLSVDSWRVVVRIDQQFHPSKSEAVNLTDLLNMINELIMDLAAISGMVAESITRTHVYRFLDLGRRLERAWQMVRLLRTCLTSPEQTPSELLEAVLEIADSLMTYRARYLANLQLTAMLDLLLTDETNPRSVAYQLSLLHAHVDNLPRDRGQAGYGPQQRAIFDMVHAVRMIDVSETFEEGSGGRSAALLALLDDLDVQLPNFSHLIAHRYLVHAGPARQLNEGVSET